MKKIKAKSLPVNLKNMLGILHDGNFHSGEALGRKLSITRSAVWKFISQLETLGIQVNSVKGRGYCLQDPLILLNIDNIKHYLTAESYKMIKSLEVLDIVSSTNDYLKQVTSTPAFVIAEKQTLGKARMGRSWTSPFAKNIYLSGNWLFHYDLSYLSGLSIMLGLAVIYALQKLNIPELMLKWPNDIMFGSKKLGGILVEIIAEAHGITNVVYGIGLNVHEAPSNYTATSLLDITKQYYNRNQIIAYIINEIINFIPIFQNKGLKPFIETWQSFDMLYNKAISLKQGNITINGLAKGINERGELLLLTSNNDLRSYSSGDTSIEKKSILI